MAGEIKLLDRLIKVGQIFKSGELTNSITHLSNGVHDLNQELKGLNSMMLTQNSQVSESVKHTKEQIEELRKGFEGLNKEMRDSNTYFERMERSSEAMENLTKVILIFTALTFAVAFSSILNSGSVIINFTTAIFVAGIIAFAIQYLLLSKRKS